MENMLQVNKLFFFKNIWNIVQKTLFSNANVTFVRSPVIVICTCTAKSLVGSPVKVIQALLQPSHL